MNSVYPPLGKACGVARTQTRQITLVGLKRRPDDGLVVDKRVCKLRAQVHVQIMTVDFSSMLICATDFACISTSNAVEKIGNRAA